MSTSIAKRLAAMFAVAALVLFSIIGVTLHRVLQRELVRHQHSELKTRFALLEHMILKCATSEKWVTVRAKLDGLTPGDGSSQYWAVSQDPRFEYGVASDDLRRTLFKRDGFGHLSMIHELHPMTTLSGTIPANEARPEVHFTVAIDSTRFHNMLDAFAISLVALSAGVIALAALLGYWMACMGLRPLGRLSLEAHALSPKNLQHRLHLSPMPVELSDLAASFNGALDRLESAYTQLEGFNADVAHELRTPLANLIGQTQVALARERTAPQLEEVLQSNLEELERLRAIVNDMLFLARADQGETATSLTPASVAREIGKAVDFLELILDEAGIRVHVQGDAQAAIETSLFRRAMTNLLHNAIQHTQAGAEIVVEVVSDAASIRIAVSNPGGEIAEDDLGRLFDRFYRVDSARGNSGENHGLGLSIVKAIAGMHGGTVFAISREGRTTVGFTVSVTGSDLNC